MSEWPRPWMPNRAEGDPQRLALLLPGGGYSPERPLLHFARAVLLAHGWSTYELWWPERPPMNDDARQREWVNHHVREVLAAQTAAEVLLVGKSLGTLAALTAADRGLSAIWLTPVLSRPEHVEDLRRATAPTLLVGGTADPLWSSQIAQELGHAVCEIEGADHGMETDDDPINSAEILKRVTVAMNDWLSSRAGS